MREKSIRKKKTFAFYKIRIQVVTYWNWFDDRFAGRERSVTEGVAGLNYYLNGSPLRLLKYNLIIILGGFFLLDPLPSPRYYSYEGWPPVKRG